MTEFLYEDSNNSWRAEQWNFTNILCNSKVVTILGNCYSKLLAALFSN